jgi:hypothetical protein
MFLSGHHFQKQCKWNLDNRYPLRIWGPLNPVKHGDSVFLKVSDIPYFIRNHPGILVSLIVHNSDESFTDNLYARVKSYVTDVSAVNCVSRHAKQIPLGLRDHQYASHHILRSVINEPEVPRTTLCLVNFLISTNPAERQAVYEMFKNNQHCLVQDQYIHFHTPNKTIRFSDPEIQRIRLEFYRTLKRCNYALCPPGTGLDTHRVYECIHLGVIPIVRSSPLDPLYATMPVKIVNNWLEVIPWLEQESRSGTQPPAQ